MNFIDMTNEEWEEVRRHHDQMVQMGRLELEAEEIRECRPAGSPPEAANHPVGRRLCELDDMVFGVSH
ncbi:MAG TPA: hypothetical protein VFK29_08940 [Rhodanobacteraceae bacterium]|jgi:hypothetical protein|nr:hypothetical protein [Rhodanobacteraceae bacterium]